MENAPERSTTWSDRIVRFLERKTALLTKYAPTSVAGIVRVVKMVFEWAVDQDWLTKNPLKKIPNSSFINRENDRIVSMVEGATCTTI